MQLKYLLEEVDSRFDGESIKIFFLKRARLQKWVLGLRHMMVNGKKTIDNFLHETKLTSLRLVFVSSSFAVNLFGFFLCYQQRNALLK